MPLLPSIQQTRLNDTLRWRERERERECVREREREREAEKV
jgi:hypothetical protein